MGNFGLPLALKARGLSVDRNERGHASVPELADATLRLAEDSDFHNRCARLALEARERFRMEPCLAQYMAIFRGEERQHA